jgi:hypothetical protein
MEKVIRDGKVAVLVSPGFGAGWYSWNSHKELLYHPKIVAMVEANRQSEIDEEWMQKEIGIPNVYCGGASDLRIEWMPEGTPFKIDEYDGSESIITQDDFDSVA